MKKTALAVALLAATGLAAGAANATSVSTGGVFAMSANLGFDQATAVPGDPGTVNTDTTITGFVNQSAGTWGVSSTTAFFGFNWTASGGQLVTAQGNYALNTTTDTVSTAAPDTVGTNDGMIHFTVGQNQVAGTINFAWSSTTGIRVVNVWNVNANGSLTTVAAPGMENGPFPGYNAAFELTGANLYKVPASVPIPAAAWLFGSGLIGLVGIARRKKSA